MTANSIVTGNLKPMYIPIKTTIELFRSHMAAENLSPGFSIKDRLEEDPGVIEIFWEFPGKQLPDIAMTIKHALASVLDRAEKSGVVYSGTIILASYDDEDPDEENQYSCFVDSNFLPVPFLKAIGDTPAVYPYKPLQGAKAQQTPKPPQPVPAAKSMDKLKHKYKDIWEDADELNSKYKKIWDEAYALGVEDQKTSASMPGVAGCFCSSSPCVCFVPPARVNPYA